MLKPNYKINKLSKKITNISFLFQEKEVNEKNCHQ